MDVEFGKQFAEGVKKGHLTGHSFGTGKDVWCSFVSCEAGWAQIGLSNRASCDDGSEAGCVPILCRRFPECVPRCSRLWLVKPSRWS
jgi:hypothetical protein